MKVTAIIAEYNPFHNGHKLQIDEIKTHTDSDQIIVVLSGAFTQRGVPAMVDQHIRAHMAIACGADMVLELPVCYATGSAQYFARGAVALLNQLGVVTSLHFGSESGDVNELTMAAGSLADLSPAQHEKIMALQQQGYSYPKARSMALGLEDEIINNPNNILGIAYIQELLSQKSQIKPCTIKRTGASYLEEDLHKEGLSSAMSIRKVLENGEDLSSIKMHVPDKVYSIMQDSDTFHPVFLDDFSDFLLYALHSNLQNGYEGFYDVSSFLSNTFRNNLPRFESFTQFCELCKSKNYTYTRINRSLLHIMLQIRQDFVDSLETVGYVPYARLLGFSEHGKELFSSIKANASIPVIAKASKASSQLSGLALDAYHQDLFVSHLYQSIRARKYHAPLRYEYSQEIIH